MPKLISQCDYDDIWFGVEIFKINKLNDVDTQVKRILDNATHLDTEYFEVETINSAIMLARNLLVKDDDYNYAIITLWRFRGDECEDSVVVGELWAEEVAQVKNSEFIN